jgi:hypothetical protein
MRFATFTQPAGMPRARAGVVSDGGIHPLPPNEGVLDLVRAGLPAALAAGRRALGEPAVPLDAVRLLTPLATVLNDWSARDLQLPHPRSGDQLDERER